MRQAARQRAKAILQADLPDYIALLDDLLEQQSKTHSSPLWEGHLKSGSFIKENVKLFLLKGAAGDADPLLERSQLYDSKEPRDSVEHISKKTGGDMGNVDDDEEASNRACWKAHLPPNEVCDRLSDLLQKSVAPAVH